LNSFYTDCFPVAWLASSLGVSTASAVAIGGAILNIALSAVLVVLRLFTNAAARARLKAACASNKAAPTPDELYGTPGPDELDL
jgi:hypothetical protein